MESIKPSYFSLWIRFNFFFFKFWIVSVPPLAICPVTAQAGGRGAGFAVRWRWPGEELTSPALTGCRKAGDLGGRYLPSLCAAPDRFLFAPHHCLTYDAFLCSGFPAKLSTLAVAAGFALKRGRPGEPLARLARQREEPPCCSTSQLRFIS